MGDLSELIERVGKLTGPDRETDWLIAEHFGEVPPHRIMEIGWDYIWYRRPGEFVLWRPTDSEGRRVETWSPAAHTASLDAAIAFKERMLPGWFWLKRTWNEMSVYRPGDGDCEAVEYASDHSIPAAALVLATLRALAASGETHNG